MTDDETEPGMTPEPQKKPSAKLSRDIQAKLGQQLRAVYDDVVNQGVPDRFSALLDQLEKSDKGKQ